MEERVLAVEDEVEWQENLRRWIWSDLLSPGSTVRLDVAGTKDEALHLLRRNHYSAIVVDLALGPDERDRGGNEVMAYLRTRSDAPPFFVLSGRADQHDVREAAFRHGAIDVLFKWEIEDPRPFRETLLRAIEASRQRKDLLLEMSQRTLLGVGIKRQVTESKILSALDIGYDAWSQAFSESLLPAVSPILQHRVRRTVEIFSGDVVGLCWSRRIGSAVAFSFANRPADFLSQAETLSNWIGFSLGESIWTKQYRDICASLWQLSELELELFDADHSGGLNG